MEFSSHVWFPGTHQGLGRCSRFSCFSFISWHRPGTLKYRSPSWYVKFTYPVSWTVIHETCTIWLWLTLCHGKSTHFENRCSSPRYGPSISMGHLYHGYGIVITRPGTSFKATGLQRSQKVGSPPKGSWTLRPCPCLPGRDGKNWEHWEEHSENWGWIWC